MRSGLRSNSSSERNFGDVRRGRAREFECRGASPYVLIMETTSKACRHCAKTEHYTHDVAAKGAYGPDLLPIGSLSGGTFEIRVCGNCGLTEFFVKNKWDLVEVKKHFRKEDLGKSS